MTDKTLYCEKSSLIPTHEIVKKIPPDDSSNYKITVVIPTGGTAGSMYPLSLGMPKEAFFIDTKPMICHILDKLDDNAFSNVIIITSRFSKLIKNCTKGFKKIHIDYIDVPEGKLAKKLKNLGLEKLENPFMLHFPDILLIDEIDWSEFITHHKNMIKYQKVIGTLMVSKSYILPVGRILTEGRLVSKIEEKPRRTLDDSINMAVSIFEPKFLEYVEESDDNIYGDSISRAIEKGEKFAFFQYENWKHIQTLSDYYDMQKEYFPSELAK